MGQSNYGIVTRVPLTSGATRSQPVLNETVMIAAVLFGPYPPVIAGHREHRHSSTEGLLVKRTAIALLLATVAAAFLLSTSSAGAQDRVRLTGSGASFPFPAVLGVVQTFSHQKSTVDYQAKGSGAGIQDFINRHGRFRRQRRRHDRRGDRQGAGRRAAPADDRRRDRAGLQPARTSNELKLPRDVYAGHLPRARSPSGTIRRSRRPTPARSCPTSTSRSSAAPTAAARPSCSRST